MSISKKAAIGATHVRSDTVRDTTAKKLHKPMNKYGIGYTVRQQKILNGEIPISLVRLAEIKALIERTHFYGDSEHELYARGLCVRKLQELDPIAELDDSLFTASKSWVDQMMDDILAGKDVNLNFLEDEPDSGQDDTDCSAETTSAGIPVLTSHKRGCAKPVLQYSLGGDFMPQFIILTLITLSSYGRKFENYLTEHQNY